MRKLCKLIVRIGHVGSLWGDCYLGRLFKTVILAVMFVLTLTDFAYEVNAIW